MADLRKTPEAWQRFVGQELVGTFLSALRELQELEDRYRKQRTQVLALNNTLPSVAAGRRVTLKGVRFGVNTTLGGLIFARIAGAPGSRTVSLYKAPGAPAAALVAEGQGAPGADVALAPRQGSGLSGSWPLPVGAQDTVGDTLQLFPVLDWPLRVRAVWDGKSEKDLDSQEVFLAALKGVARRIQGARQVLAEALLRFSSGHGSRGAEFLELSTSAAVTDARVRDRSGAVARRRAGFLPALSAAMEEDSLAGEQSVVERLVAASPGVFSPKNRGQGRLDAHQPREFCVAARWTFRCVRGEDSGHGGREEFACTAKVTGEDRTIQFSGVRVGQSFSGPEGIGPFVLERVYTKTKDDQHEHLARAKEAAVTGERSGNTDGGVLYWRIEQLGNIFRVYFYRSANRAQGDLVAEAQAPGSGLPFVATERQVSGLNVVWRLGTRPQDRAEGTLDCNFFRVENQAGVPDTFVVTTRIQSEGLIQKVLVEQLGGTLHGKPAGQETISDDHLRAGVLLP
ncbi:MAG TPA: hypothetical protein DEA08_29720 [Planctomycetes bacterium]|nr:hypothetical protein [Planctomycetota bacterium]